MTQSTRLKISKCKIIKKNVSLTKKKYCDNQIFNGYSSEIS